MILFLSSSYAQKSRFGFQAGGTLSWLKGGDFYPESKIDFTGGILYDIAVTNSFVIQPQLNFVSNGGESDYYNSRLNLGYVEMPVNFYYRQKAANGFFIGGGPYIGFAVSGKVKSELGDHEIQFGNEYTDDYRRVDFGINLVSGYLLPNGLQFALNYSAGFTNISPVDHTPVDGTNPYTRNIGLRISYLLK
jgi:hypothetical protein